MLEADFVGTWRLVSMEGRLSDGTVTYPLGADAHGFIMYAADGYMSVAISAAERPRLGTSDLLAGSDEQLAAAARTFISYAGRYSVEGELVRHAVDVSLFPDWAGGIQERRFRFEGHTLELSTDPIPWGGKERTAVLVWERIPHAP
jgi:Lipocalin-like domain